MITNSPPVARRSALHRRATAPFRLYTQPTLAVSSWADRGSCLLPLIVEVSICSDFTTYYLAPGRIVGRRVAACGSPAFGEEPRIDNSLHPIGEDFRVDNAVFAGDKKEPISRSVTIFHDGIVYDCMKTPAETVVFDKMLNDSSC